MKKLSARTKKIASWAVFALLIAVFLFAAYKLIKMLVDYRTDERDYAHIVDIAVGTPDPEKTPSYVSIVTPAPGATEIPSEVPISVDWGALREINGEVVGWLYSEGTPINYPVVQTDDNDYYISHNFEKNRRSVGALFVDCRNDLSASDENIIIYGHRMRDDSMFGSVPEYFSADYYALHPIMYYITPTQAYRVELFSCRTVEADMKYYATSFDAVEDYAAFLNRAVSQSYWDAPFEVDTDCTTLTLVTCSSYESASDPRILLHGRLIPIV